MTQREFFEAMAKLVGLFFFASGWITVFNGVGFSFYSGFESDIVGEYLLRATSYFIVGLFLMQTSSRFAELCFPEKTKDDFE